MINKIKLQKGASLVEVMVATLIFAIVILGGSYPFIHGRCQIDLQKNSSVAVQLACQKLEGLKAGPYSDVEEGSSQEQISLEDLSFTRSVVTEDLGSYKKVKVCVNWDQLNKDNEVSLVTLIAPE